jgi:hypothetical protein
MRKSLVLVVLMGVVGGCGFAQSGGWQDPLLDRLTGHWVLHGTLAGKETTHDVAADWVLGHEYVRLHEVSREKNRDGQPAYEAIVFVGWDASSSQYACLWLDSTGGGGLSGQAIAHAKRSGDELPFVFKESDGSISFTNTFVHHKESDSWAWIMDNVEKGKSTPFARLTLERQ